MVAGWRVGMCATGSEGRACPLVACGGEHVPWTPATARAPANRCSGALHAPGAARRGRRHFLGRHYEGECDDDVGVAGADGAHAVGAFHELAKGIRQSAVDPVPDHNAGAERGAREELLGQGQGRAHLIIVRRGACVTSR